MSSEEQVQITGMVISRSPDLVRILLSDGSTRDSSDIPWPDLGTNLNRVVVGFRPAALILQSRSADLIVPELPRPGVLAPLAGRPIIYLDQNHWSTLSKARFARNRIPTRELQAAETLLGLASRGQIVMPMSGGHLSETTSWASEESRYQLGLTILQLARGWQLRDPYDVRRRELVNAMRDFASLSGAPAVEAITLEPWALQSELRRSDRGEPLADLPMTEDTRFLFRIVLAANVYSALILDRTPIQRDRPGNWTASQQRFTDWLAGESNRTRAAKRMSAEVFALQDISKELAGAASSAGVSPDEMSTWTHKRWWESTVSNTPACTIYRNMLVDKHLDPVTRWEDNDLTDLWFLATAAAYCDYVVAERRAVGLLAQAKRRTGLGGIAVRSIADLIDALPPELVVP